MSGEGWGEGTARDAAYDLVDEAIRSLMGRSLDEFRHLLPGRSDIGEVRDRIADIRASLANRRESEKFPWEKVRVGAVFIHSRYRSGVDRQPDRCRIYRLTYGTDHAIQRVFYEIGGPPGDRVYSEAAEFPAAVREWVTA